MLVLVACATQQTTKNTQPEDDGCVFNFAGFHSYLDDKSKKFSAIEPEKKDFKEKVVRQNAWLMSGEKVEFFGSGCAHMGFSFRYSQVKSPGKTVKAHVQAALRFLQKTPVKDDFPTRILKEALKKAIKKPPVASPIPGEFPLSCGDAQCILAIEGADTLRVSYDMAL